MKLPAAKTIVNEEGTFKQIFYQGVEYLVKPDGQKFTYGGVRDQLKAIKMMIVNGDFDEVVEEESKVEALGTWGHTHLAAIVISLISEDSVLTSVAMPDILESLDCLGWLEDGKPNVKQAKQEILRVKKLKGQNE